MSKANQLSPHAINSDTISTTALTSPEFPLVTAPWLVFEFASAGIHLASSIPGFDPATMIDAATYGVTANGGDVTTNILHAAEAAEASGKSLFFEPGTYDVSQYFTLYNGASWLAVPGTVTLQAAPTQSAMLVAVGSPSAGSGQSATPIQNVSITGIDFQGGSQSDGSSPLFTSWIASGVTLDNDSFTNINGVALLLSNTANATISNCTFDNIGNGTATSADPTLASQAIAFTDSSSYQSTSNQVINCNFTSIGLDAISATQQTDFSATDNTMVDLNTLSGWNNAPAGAAGVYMFDVNNSNVVGNSINGASGNGIDILQGTNLHIDSNTVSFCYESGIAIADVNTVEVDQNVSDNNNQLTNHYIHGDGIVIVGDTNDPSSNITLSQNTCTDNQVVKTQNFGFQVIGGTPISNLQVDNSNNFVGNRLGLLGVAASVSNMVWQGVLTVASNNSLNGGTLEVTGNQTLDNAALTFGGTGGYLAVMSASGSLTLGSNFTVNQSRGHNYIIGIQQTSSTSSSFTTSDNASYAAIVNNGTINISGGILTVAGVFTTNGSLLLSGGTVDGSNSTFTASGSVEVDSGSVLKLGSNASLTTVAGNITLRGTGSTIEWLTTATNSETTIDQALSSIASGGTLRLLAGRGLTVVANNGTFSDGGVLTLGGGAFATAALAVATVGDVFGYGSITGVVTNLGFMEVNGGLLKIATSLTGSGLTQVDGGATLELAGNSSSSVAFNGASATFKLDMPGGFTGTISNPVIGDTVDLAGVTVLSATVVGSSLIVNSTGGTLTYQLSNAAVSGVLLSKTDGAGGSVVLFNQLAQASSLAAVTFGSVHVGAIVSKALTITNTAPTNGESENLDGSIGNATNGLIVSGTFTALAAGASSSALLVSISAAAAGLVTGTAVVSLMSDGTSIDGLGTTALPSQTVHVTGTAYAYAAPVLSAGTISLGATRVGAAALTGSVTLADGIAASPYQESLIYQFAVPTGFTVSNASGTLASGGSAGIGVSLATIAAGNFTGILGGEAASFFSTGAGTSGLANTALTAPGLVVSGQVYAPAVASLSSTTVNFGVVHVGDVVNVMTLTVTNGASGALTDFLIGGTASESGSYTGSVGAALASGLAVGASGSITFGLNTASAGIQNGSVSLGYESYDAALSDLAVTAAPVTVTGTVDAYAVASLQLLSGQTLTRTGNAYILNLGTYAQNSGAVIAMIDVANSASGQADALAGTFVTAAATGFTNTGFVSFSGIAAGTTSASETISLSTTNYGTFTETFTLDTSSTNASSSTSLAPETLTVIGTVGPTYILQPGTVTITAATGNDTFVAAGGVLNSGDSLTGGPGGFNTLDLSGGSEFDLNAPKVLANIQIVEATEGQAATSTLANTVPYVLLRDGTNVTLDVAGGVPNAANPNASRIVIYGAADASVLNLGPGSDTVVLGSAMEAVNGGSGTALIQATAALASAPVRGKIAGATTLEITSGGTLALNASDTYVTVRLDAASVLTLNKMAFISAVGEVAGNTIIAAAAGQTLGGLAGGDTLAGYTGFGDTFQGLAAGLNGDIVENFGGTGANADKIDITDLAPSATLKYVPGAGQGLLALDGSAHSLSLTMLGTFSPSGFHLTDDGLGGSFVTYG